MGDPGNVYSLQAFVINQHCSNIKELYDKE